MLASERRKTVHDILTLAVMPDDNDILGKHLIRHIELYRECRLFFLGAALTVLVRIGYGKSILTYRSLHNRQRYSTVVSKHILPCRLSDIVFSPLRLSEKLGSSVGKQLAIHGIQFRHNRKLRQYLSKNSVYIDGNDTAFCKLFFMGYYSVNQLSRPIIFNFNNNCLMVRGYFVRCHLRHLNKGL